MRRTLVVLLLWAFGVVSARAEDIVLFDGARVATVVYDQADDPAIETAAGLLARDLTALTGRAPTVAARVEGLSGPAIIFGTYDTPMIAALMRANAIDANAIAGKWESYGRAIVPAPWDARERVLVIFGSDRRGAIYGMIDLTREMGVSAWEWWADVAIQRVDRIVVNEDLSFSREPSVRYRGVFPNDEDWGLQPWAARTYEPEVGDIGPRTYARVFELLWRLKANTIWPAMHDSTAPFFTIAGNAETADRYAIVVGSSHAEPMLRNNVREWDDATMGQFNYFTNRDRMQTYWRTRVDQARPLESIFSVGLRGVHDQPMQGADDANAARDAMARVIADQRAILTEQYSRPANQILQAFTAYSEVLDIYDSGLALPEDVTLVWPDDNYGYLRRLGNVREQRRAGGSGIYYHASYWGRPHDYLWLGTTHPALIHEQMQRAYTLGARNLWILNVGDIKPIEYLTEYFLDLAFDARTFEQNPRAHLREWAGTNFGAERAEAISGLLWRYYDLAFERRPEFMGWSGTEPTTSVRPTAYVASADGFEAQARLDAYGRLAGEAAQLALTMPEDRRDAFFELAGYPIRGAASLNARVLNLDLAQLYARQGRASANLHASRARDAHAALVEDARRYNETIAGGKWRGMMDIAPRRLPVFDEPVYPSWSAPGEEGCGAALQGGRVLRAGGGASFDFTPGAEQEQPIDLFLRRPGSASWRASSNAAWLRLSASEGRFSAQEPDIQLSVSTDAQAPPGAEAEIRIHCGAAQSPIRIAVRMLPRAPAGVSFVEIDGMVAIGAAHADEISAHAEGWRVLDGLGHRGASLRSNLATAALDAPRPAAIRRAPSALYRFATRSGNAARLRVVALPTHPLVRGAGVRIAVSIDNAAPIILDFETHGRSDRWRRNVLANAAIAELDGLALAPGLHEMRVYALDPGIILDRFEIAFDGARQLYGPAPETRIRH